jgi:hypothetical protein
MFVGALVGGVLIVHAQRVYPLAIVLIVAAAVAGTTLRLGAGDPTWSLVND